MYEHANRILKVKLNKILSKNYLYKKVINSMSSRQKRTTSAAVYVISLVQVLFHSQHCMLKV